MRLSDIVPPCNFRLSDLISRHFSPLFDESMPLHYHNKKDLGMCYDGRVALLILRTANGKSSELDVRFARLDVAARRLRSSRHLVRPDACLTLRSNYA